MGHGGGQDKREFGSSSKADTQAMFDNFVQYSEKAISPPYIRILVCKDLFKRWFKDSLLNSLLLVGRFINMDLTVT